MFDLTVNKLQLFLVIGLPGFVALKVFDLLCPPQKRDFGSSVIEIVAYSLINLALWSWAVIPLIQKEYAEKNPAQFSLYSFGMFVVSPAVLAWATYAFRTSRYGSWLDHPTRTAWDWFFWKRRSCWVLFRFKNGMMLGGCIGPDSFAATYPEEKEVYVEEVWQVDEGGRFKQKVPGSLGMLVRFSECDYMEFFGEEQMIDGRPETGEDDGRSSSDPGGCKAEAADGVHAADAKTH